MPVSKNGTFKVSIVNSKTQREFTELVTPEKKNYICVENNQPFKINIIADNEHTDKSFGCHLYLDGKIVKGKKTFRAKGWFHGFKQGGGKFREFLFSIPPQGEEEKKEVQEVDSSIDIDNFGNTIYKRPEYLGSEYFGTVHLRFFKCKEGKMKPAKAMNNAFNSSFHQASRTGDVKVAYKSMSVKEGECFEFKSAPFKRRKIEQEDKGWGNDDKENKPIEKPRMFKEYIILERKGPVDEVTIHYGDIAALQVLGIISLDNYQHLMMIPPPLLAEASYVIKVFKTIVDTKKKIHIKDCGLEFHQATACKLDDLFLNVEEELPEFFKIKSDIFHFAHNGVITLNKFYKEHSVSSRRLKGGRSHKKVQKLNQPPEVIEID
ncbi:unnamed protein product [Moneuplotes crassus]|uniref:Uncharacterized protein n=1 Tax=Euplotes crassus TaxID=5936 RepID=A0AAD1UL32_EUPCR|nr:unnamed protein product [Moneuplotes crassus]